MTNIDIGIFSVNDWTVKCSYDSLHWQYPNNLSYSYSLYTYPKLSLSKNSEISFIHEKNIQHLKEAIYKVVDKTFERTSVVLFLDNLYVSLYQLTSDSDLNELLEFINENKYFVVFSSNLVYNYIHTKYPDIKLIIGIGRHRNNTDKIKSCLKEFKNIDIEIGYSIYSNLIPLIEFSDIDANKIWLSFENCGAFYCPLQDICSKCKSFGLNHKRPILDIKNPIWKQHIGYKPCYIKQTDIDIIDYIRNTANNIENIHKRGIHRFFIKNICFDTPFDISLLFASSEFTEKTLKEQEHGSTESNS